MNRRKINNKGFTLVEIMTAVVIVAILVSVLIPAVNKARKLALEIRQKAQFTAISTGIELFRNDFGEYPESYPRKETNPGNYNTSYTGAQQLAEAMVGLDSLGVSKYTVFREDGLGDVDGDGNFSEDLYLGPNDNPPADQLKDILAERKGPYIAPDKLGVYTVEDLYGTNGYRPNGDLTVLITDTFKKKNVHISQAIDSRNGNKGAPSVKAGMPVVYFRADTTKISQNLVQGFTNRESIYCVTDNMRVLGADIPWNISASKAGAYTNDYALTVGVAAQRFNEFIVNDKLGTTAREMPYNPNSYILVSAGPDGLFGTDDDMFNFDRD